MKHPETLYRIGCEKCGAEAIVNADTKHEARKLLRGRGWCTVNDEWRCGEQWTRSCRNLRRKQEERGRKFIFYRAGDD